MIVITSGVYVSCEYPSFCRQNPCYLLSSYSNRSPRSCQGYQASLLENSSSSSSCGHRERDRGLCMLQFQFLELLIEPRLFRQSFHHGQRASNYANSALNDSPKDNLARLVQVVVLGTVSIGVYCSNHGGDRSTVPRHVSLSATRYYVVTVQLTQHQVPESARS